MRTTQEAEQTAALQRPAGGRRVRRWLFILSGLIGPLALLGSPPDPTLLIYSLFVLLWLVRPAPGHARPARFAAAVVGAGLLLECFAWLNNFLECNPAPELLHAQLIPDLTLALAFYGSWAAGWLLVLRWFAFTPRQLFVTQGLFGVFVEQQGAVFLLGLASFPLGMIWWVYVFAVYGAVVGIGALLAGVPAAPAARSMRRKYPLALLAIVLAFIPIAFGWGALVQALGLIPTPAPICERPLW